MEWEFSLVLEGDPEPHLDELYEAGCSDGVFGRQSGVAFADFTREADSMREAIDSAIAQIESVPGLKVAHWTLL